MIKLMDLMKLISSLPLDVLWIVVILASFGLAAFAIYAVLSVAKKDK